MKNNENYYGIYLNDKIPKLDKKNKFSKEVEIKFEGQAYLIERTEDDEIEKTKIENESILNREGDYEIEFTNLKNESYTIELRIESSYLFLLLLLFILGFIIGLILSNPVIPEESSLAHFFDYINIAILRVNIDEQEIEEPIKDEYDFDVDFENISSDDISLNNSINAKSLVKNKIAPGVSGNFAINLSTKKSTIDMKYKIKFQDVTNEKPTNMEFSIRGTNQYFSTLQELEKYLIGRINKKSQKKIIIDWKWNYENGESNENIKFNDRIDTKEGNIFNSYKFKIIVTGEEAI